MKWFVAVMSVACLSFGTVVTVHADSQNAGFSEQRLTAEDMADLLGGMTIKKPGARVENNPVILKALGGLSWGMSSDQAMDVLASEGKSRKALRRSYVTFDGQATSWEDTPVASQYTHGNGEAMLVFKRGANRTHLFFMQDKLWKLFETVSKSESGTNFHRFSRTLRRRFGAGHVHTVGDVERWIEFGSKRTRVRGLDGGEQAAGYGVVFEDRPTLAKLSSMRVATVEPIAIAAVTPVKVQPITQSHREAVAEAKATNKILDAARMSGPKARTAVAAKVRIKAPVHRELDSMASLDDDDPLTGL